MKLVKLWVLVLGLGWGLVCWGEQGGVNDPGEEYFQRGEFELAVGAWKANYSNLSVGQLLGLATAYQQLGRLREALWVLKETLNDKNLQSSEQAQVLMQLSELYLGMRVVDRELLEVTKLPGVCSKSESLLSEGNRERDHADILIEEAEKCLSESETLLAKNIEKSGARLQANLFNSKGNLLVAKAERKKLDPKYKEALAVYHEGDGLSKEASSEILAQKEKAKQEAEKALKAYDKTLMEAYEKALTEAYGKGEQLANDAGDKLLAAKIAVNIVQVLTEQQKCELAETKSHEILPQLMDLPDSHDKVFTLIGLAAQFTPLFTALLQSSVDRQKPRCRFSKKEDKRFFVLDEARKVAERLVKVDKGEKTAGKKTAMAYVEGYLAQLYIEQKRYEEAQQLTRQAIFHTQESADSADLLSAPAQLFRWEWQLGKLFDLQKESEQAIRVYRQAAKHLEITKNRCGGVSRAFLKEGEDFYYEYAELLYRQYPKTEPAKIAELLEELTDVIESFKTTQLQNYFYTECADDLIEKTKQLRRSQNNVATTTREIFADEKFSFHPTFELSSPFMFASSMAKNITSLLGVSHSLIPQFGSIGLSLGLRKQGGLPISPTKQDCSKVEKFDNEFFSCYPETAVLYLFVLDKTMAQEVVLILNSRAGPQFIEPGCSPCSDLIETVNTFRTQIKNKRPFVEFVESSKLLYNWLIAPLKRKISENRPKIDTLVLIPSVILHTLPFAALWDEDDHKYLIQEYALVITPAGASLTAFNHHDYKNALLAGLSKPVQTLPALKAKEELEGVGEYFNNEKLIDGEQENGRDKSFTISNVSKQLIDNSYSIVHFSTHGIFSGEEAKDAYLLTYDAVKTGLTLPMDRFKEIISVSLKHNDKVELLVLSACQSAVGGERAALGLAGAGISAGARSAIGTLWLANDVTTQRIMIEFYKALTAAPPNSKKNKAKALQVAQKLILETSQDEKFKHPFYWAAFLLTGNWL